MHLCTLAPTYTALLLESLAASPPSARVAVAYLPVTSKRDKAAMPMLTIGEAAALVTPVHPRPHTGDFPAAPLLRALQALRDAECVEVHADKGNLALNGPTARFEAFSYEDTLNAVKTLVALSRREYGMVLYSFSADGATCRIDVGDKRYRVPVEALTAREWFMLLSEETGKKE